MQIRYSARIVACCMLRRFTPHAVWYVAKKATQVVRERQLLHCSQLPYSSMTTHALRRHAASKYRVCCPRTPGCEAVVDIRTPPHDTFLGGRFAVVSLALDRTCTISATSFASHNADSVGAERVEGGVQSRQAHQQGSPQVAAMSVRHCVPWLTSTSSSPSVPCRSPPWHHSSLHDVPVGLGDTQVCS